MAVTELVPAPPAPRASPLCRHLVPGLIGLGSALLVAGSASGVVALRLDEVLGFVTGAACVWLTVKQNIWSFPIGIANNLFYVVLFLAARLYADTSLQLVYIALGALGWYWWLRGGANRTRLTVTRTPARAALGLASGLVAVTTALTALLAAVDDAAPFLDALTTTASLVAQLMLSRKWLENWLVWMATDVVYVYLYAARGLYLTALLYALFFVLCVAGLRQWWRALAPARPAALVEGASRG
ncbi:MAG: nicotinamide mononucleotide transporter [Polyangiaceae bacterium]|nr:nicotinamide mononucleotide transporter [Polyangiaceae bacterium]